MRLIGETKFNEARNRPDMVAKYLPSVRSTEEVTSMAALRSWRQFRRYRATVRELERLSPRELDELGIVPAQITRLARAAAGM